MDQVDQVDQDIKNPYVPTLSRDPPDLEDDANQVDLADLWVDRKP
jgi:hypothetical protein